jgi:hypothetical protein
MWADRVRFRNGSQDLRAEQASESRAIEPRQEAAFATVALSDAFHEVLEFRPLSLLARDLAQSPR